MILSCGCDHKGQDALHGQGRRVFNLTTKGQAGQKVFRCTVCGAERAVGGSEVKGKKGKKGK